MQIDEANISNLKGLWKKYGSKPLSSNSPNGLLANTHWPNRVWFDHTLADTSFENTDWLGAITPLNVFPVWNDSVRNQLDKDYWHCIFEQTAMYKILNDTETPLARPGFQIKEVKSEKEFQQWVAIASDAFGYEIDLSVIEKLAGDSDIKILLGIQNKQAVASGILFKTEGFIGIHQVGVLEAFQGQGIARYFMKSLLDICADWNGEFAVLQASQAGKPLYESLGFKDQFLIRNYQLR